MKTVFDSGTLEELNARLSHLQSDSERQWGKMSAPQMLAHCSRGIEMAAGDIKPPRIFIGRIIGPIIKPIALREDEPMRRNSPTAPVLLVQDDKDFSTEKAKFCECLNQFATTGPQACTSHPHAFFGPLTPDQWGILVYKHVDHHLRQFGA
jgi:hypothetical protein